MKASASLTALVVTSVIIAARPQGMGDACLPCCFQVSSFDTNEWDGRWYITAGLNPAFDIFDCQVCGHELQSLDSKIVQALKVTLAHNFLKQFLATSTVLGIQAPMPPAAACTPNFWMDHRCLLGSLLGSVSNWKGVVCHTMWSRI